MHSKSWFMAAVGAVLLATPVLGGAQERLPRDHPIGAIDDTGSSLPQVQQQNGISYISGGVSSDEADAFKSMSDGFNLKLTASTPSGQFTSPSTIRIDDARGSKVLEVTPKGPIFLAKLPSGEYVVQATAEGQTMTRKVTVPASGMESITMSWPAAGPRESFGDAPE